MATSSYRNKEWLERKYWEEEKTLEEISDEVNVCKQTVLNWMKKHEISRRDPNNDPYENEPYRDKNWLEEKYLEEEKSLTEISDEIDRSPGTIRKWLKKFNIPRREPGLRGKKNPSWKEKVELTCPACGQKFKVVPSRKESRKYCSTECKYKNWSGKPENKIKINCDWCGKEFERIPAKAGRRNHDFCSKECYHKWQSRHMSGENNYRWKGGGNLYYGPNWERQKRKALKRDNHTCQRCEADENGMKLHVHHIVPFRKFGTEDYKKANRLENLITLCRKCHMELEWDIFLGGKND